MEKKYYKDDGTEIIHQKGPRLEFICVCCEYKIDRNGESAVTGLGPCRCTILDREIYLYDTPKECPFIQGFPTLEQHIRKMKMDSIWKK